MDSFVFPALANEPETMTREEGLVGRKAFANVPYKHVFSNNGAGLALSGHSRCGES